jgi:hypothetical protein
VEKIAERVQAHFDSGEDHVCLQVIADDGSDVASSRPAWRELAGVLL